MSYPLITLPANRKLQKCSYMKLPQPAYNFYDNFCNFFSSASIFLWQLMEKIEEHPSEFSTSHCSKNKIS